MPAESTIQKQVEAYNSRNITQFASCHSDDVQLFNFGEQKPFCVGNEKLKEIYADIFDNSPNLHTEVLNRIIMGNSVIDHEIVTGRKGVDILELIAIYEVVDDKISKAYFKRKG